MIPTRPLSVAQRSMPVKCLQRCSCSSAVPSAACLHHVTRGMIIFSLFQIFVYTSDIPSFGAYSLYDDKFLLMLNQNLFCYMGEDMSDS